MAINDRQKRKEGKVKSVGLLYENHTALYICCRRERKEKWGRKQNTMLNHHQIETMKEEGGKEKL